MKILWRLRIYGKPWSHFFPEYIIYSLLGIVFGLLNFTLLIPILQLLFDQNTNPVTQKPSGLSGLAYIQAYFNYCLWQIIGTYGRFTALLTVCGIVGLSILIGNTARYLAIRTLLRLKLKVMQVIRNDIYGSLLQQSLSYHNNQRRGDLLSVIGGEVQEVEVSALNAVQVLLRDPIVVIAYLFVLFYISPVLTLFTLIFLPVTGIFISMITRKLKKLSFFSQQDLSQMIIHTDETISGMRQIHSYTAEAYMLSRFKAFNSRFSGVSKKLFSRKEMATPIGEISGVFAALVLIAIGGYLILNGKSALTGPSFIAYLAMYTQIIQPLKNISQMSSNVQRGIVACEKIFRVIDAERMITNSKEAKGKASFQHDITFADVSFSYSERNVLNKISFRLQRGQTIALVGPSGSGKSTLADLMMRFYDVSNGSILIDGVDIRDIRIEDIRHMTAMVSQDTFLFNDTVYNNIALGNLQASREQVVEAAKAANAHEFIRRLDNGYETTTGDRGVKLSGGQRQRIAIARAILKNAPILILDEATSALDNESELLVQEALNKLMKDRTTIIIAHRLSTVRQADSILVLDHGKLIEQGNHLELINQKGQYWKMIHAHSSDTLSDL